MDLQRKRTRKVTMKDILDEVELELLGITQSHDGYPVSSIQKINSFFCDSGMYKDPKFLEIKHKYRNMFKDKKLVREFSREISEFKINYFNEQMEIYKKKP